MTYYNIRLAVHWNTANDSSWPTADDRTRATGTSKTVRRVIFVVFPTFLFGPQSSRAKLSCSEARGFDFFSCFRVSTFRLERGLPRPGIPVCDNFRPGNFFLRERHPFALPSLQRLKTAPGLPRHRLDP